VLFQNLPGTERFGAAMLLVEIGTDMAVFSGAERLASWVGLLSRQPHKRG
jgi:transposase